MDLKKILPVMFSERLNEFVVRVGENPNSIERKVGVSKGTIYKAIKNGRTIGVDVLVKIFSHYPQLNLEWLIAGRGTMFKDQVGVAAEPLDLAEDDRVDYTLLKGVKTAVRLISERKLTDWDGGYDTIEAATETLFYLPASLLPKGRRYVAFPVVGDSMEPTLPAKSKLITEEVVKEDYPRLQNGAVYFIVTHDRKVIRRVTNRLEERRALHVFSDNREYASYDIAEDDLVSIWRAKAFFSARFTSEPDHLYRLYQDLEARIKFLEERGEA